MLTQLLLRFVIILGIVTAGIMYLSYEINTRADKKYQEAVSKLEKEQLLSLEKLQNKQNNIIAGYLSQINAMKKQHEKEMTELYHAKYKDTINSSTANERMQQLSASGNSGVSKASDKSDIICYAREQFQRKIKESLDIANECDELALKYKALYDTCKGEINDK